MQSIHYFEEQKQNGEKSTCWLSSLSYQQEMVEKLQAVHFLQRG